ncbi:MAG TPA: RNA-binding protein [Candidatus Binataceae bacterium]|jgi:RNA recognition motif-containing protein|nr:RNA-binding protein [Candidatus Binataceae bacterium]
MRLFVGNLPFDVTERELRDLVIVHAGIEKIEIVKDRATGASKGFAFVELISSSDAPGVIDALHRATLHGRKLRVEEARPRESRKSRERF